MRSIKLSKNKLEKIFTEWDRRYRENPKDFVNVVDHLLKDTPYSYGKGAAEYFNILLSDLS